MPTYETLCNDDDPRWHEYRRELVTATTAAQLLGVHRFGSLLGTYMRMRGMEPDGDDGDRSFLDWGTDMEESVVVNMRRRGFAVERAAMLLRSVAYPWMGATIDGWVTEGGARLPFEIKTTRSREQAKAWEEGTPPDVRAQVQHQLIVSCASRALVAVVIYGAPPRYIWVDRDAQIAEDIVRMARAFWERVQRGDPPPPDDSADARRALDVDPEHGKTISLGIDAVTLTEAYETARTREKIAKAQADALKNKIRAMMGDAQIANLPGVKTGYWTVVSSTRQPYVKVIGLDEAAVAERLRDTAAEVDGFDESISRSLRLFGR